MSWKPKSALERLAQSKKAKGIKEPHTETITFREGFDFRPGGMIHFDEAATWTQTFGEWGEGGGFYTFDGGNLKPLHREYTKPEPADPRSEAEKWAEEWMKDNG